MGTAWAWRLKDQRKTDFLASNRTQTGQITPAYLMASSLEAMRLRSH